MCIEDPLLLYHVILSVEDHLSSVVNPTYIQVGTKLLVPPCNIYIFVDNVKIRNKIITVLLVFTAGLSDTLQ